MPKYRKKPIIVEAEQYTGDNNPFGALEPCTPEAEWVLIPRNKSEFVIIEEVHKGNWIIKYPSGRFETREDRQFQATYEEVME